jgi:hypothetical protein
MSWPAYFDACNRNDTFAAFEALAAIGVLPVVNGEDKKGKIKRPMAGPGEAWQNITTDQWRERLIGYLQNGVPVGIGCKPVGFLVVDVDPLDKDTRRLPTAWKEAAQFLFGCDDWPSSMVAKTEGGAHVWFVVTDSILVAWQRSGKLKIKLPSGDAIEIFVGVSDAGSQVACAPSEGKRISIPMEPILLPESAEQAILRALTRPEKAKDELSKVIGNASSDYEWAKTVLAQGYLDTELADYDKWLAVGMALSHKFGEEGAELWEEWSARHDKHVDGECGVKVRSFKRTDGDKQIRFGTLIQIAKANGAAAPQLSLEPVPMEFFEGMPDASNARDILDLMKERTWLWGNPETNVGWFVKRGLHLVEGKEGTGKTRWLMDLCRRWSNDLKWPDGTSISMDIDSKILFVAADSHWDQVAMCSESFGIDPENVIFTGPKNDPYGFTNLDDPKTIAIIRLWCERYKIGLVVIDTLMAASSRPLVDPQEVAKIASPLRELAREMNVAVVLVGHLNSQGETWGRAMGRTCDHVIRMEAEDHDEQSITIKSVKARWNRFALPVIQGRQGECGWEYSTTGSDSSDDKQVKPRAAAEEAIRKYLTTFGKAAWGEIQAELQENGHTKSTVNRALKTMVSTMELVTWDEKYPSGKSCSFYQLDPKFQFQTES